MSGDRRQHVAVVGGGWAGLAAAVRAVQRGCRVSLFEMAPQLGGRARSAQVGDWRLDNGQHILIGAYRDTLELMRDVGVDLATALHRMPLALVDADGVGLTLPPGRAIPSFARGVLGATHWPLSHRLSLLMTAARWGAHGFNCDAMQTVSDLVVKLPRRIQQELIEPLCVAALNTPAHQASGQVFLRVLRDALFGGRGASDLLLPQMPLAQLLPGPAGVWLEAAGARVCLRSRVQSLAVDGDAPSRWLVDGESFDGVMLACSANDAARLAAPINVFWSGQASRVAYQSIVTVYVHHPDAKLAFPMTTLVDSVEHPAQFAFDHGMLTRRRGLLAFVVSGANPWLLQGLQATVDATLRQARHALPSAPWIDHLNVVGAIAERRATFACIPSLQRPTQRIAPGLLACGDYVDGPYPATLEGAVRSGRAAAERMASPDAR